MMKAKLIIATDKSYGVHPMEGILQIHFDQLNTIAKHLEDIKRDQEMAAMQQLPEPTIQQSAAMDPNIPDPPPKPTPAPNPHVAPIEELAQSFTKKQLLKRDDWPEWQQGIYKQLNQYWEQILKRLLCWTGCNRIS